MLFNLLGFNLSWFGLILLGNLFIPLSLLWLWLHLSMCKYAQAEVKLISSVTLIGVLVDTILHSTGILIFPNQYFIPLWLITLWAAFAATIAHSLQFLKHSKLLQALIGSIFPPLSYLAGASLSIVDLGYGQLVTYFILAPIWSVLMIIFFQLKDIFYEQVTNDA